MFAGSTVFAQAGGSNDAVSWNYSAKKVAADTYEVHMTATVKAGWHIYAQAGGDGPVYTSFSFTKSPLFALTGPVKEVGKKVSVFEKAFNSKVNYYENTVDFVQTVKLKASVKTKLVGKVSFMTCNDHECLPPSDLDFAVPIS